MAWILASFLGSVCKIVANIGFKEYILLRDGKEEIMNLRRTVSVVMGKLKDAETKQVESHAFRGRLKELKQVLFEAEDVLDEIATDEALEKRDAEDGTSRPPKVRKLNFFGVDISSSSRAIAHRVKRINKKLDDILNDKDMLELHVSNETSGPVMGTIFRRPPSDTSSLLPKEARIIGRDDEMRELEELLLEHYAEGTIAATRDNYKNVHVISVVGMGGVGKTILVKHAYNSPAVTKYFQLRMWVCVSSYFDVKRVTGEIMDAAASSSAGTSNWDAAQKSLQGKLEGKRFLLVLDDVWEEDPSKWEDLCTPLMYGGKGSKIIVTTRSQKVSNITKGIPILLKDLSSKDLWSIFQTYAFDYHDPDKHTQLVIVGKQIVDNLKGSPLAAKTIGRLLNLNLDVGHWTNIMESKTWMSPASENSILPILKLSYDYLPGHLKQCFAYCSLFLEDHKFDKDELVQLWMAQQFIHVETLGREYFDDLVCMSLFEKCITRYGQKRFVMHDLIHNLTEIVSEGDCLRLEDNQQNGTILDTVRHVSIASGRFDLSKIEQLCNNCENMRTLLFLRGCILQLDLHLDNIFMKLRRLRVLGLSDCGIEELPASIGALKHLRLLDLSNNLISKLPESLCNLHNLQVLKLKGCRRLRALPQNTSALVNLRHLELDTEIASCVPGLGKLTALQELILNGSKVGELADMGMLKELRIWGLEGVTNAEEAVCVRARLEAKEHLELLELKWCQSGGNRPRQHSVSEEEEVVDALKPVNRIRQLCVRSYEGARSPKWMGDPSWVSTSLLVKVVLSECTNWEVLPPLGQLPCLRKLHLSYCEKLRELPPLPPTLTELRLDSVGVRSPKWMVDPSWVSTSLLVKVELCDCRKWEVLPPLGQLPCLKVLEISKMPAVRRIGPEFFFFSCCCRDDGGGVKLAPGFPSLEELKFGGMPEWEEWESPVVLLEQQQQHPSFFPRLRTLDLYDCEKLRELPPLPPTLTYLFLHKVGLTRLPGWILERCSEYDIGRDDVVIMPASTSTSSSPSRMLSSLVIEGCPNITSLGGAAGLVSLQDLTIDNCPKLLHLVEEEGGAAAAAVMSSPPVIPSSSTVVVPKKIISVKTLTAWSCSPKQIATWLRQVSSLQLLVIWDCPKLRCFGAGDDDDTTINGGDLLEGALLDLAPSLRELDIRFCENLSSLPSKLRSLTGLETLWIHHCPKIQRLPSAGLPQTLRALDIRGCPELEQGCREEGCPDWPLLSHIPHVDIQGYRR